MDFNVIIKNRRSIRSYQPKPLEPGVIDEILDCARLAPTAINIQPWLIGCVTDQKLLGRLAELADHGRFIKDCAACFAVFCEKDKKYYLEDGCAATMNILYAAASRGVGTCWIAGDKKEYADQVRDLLKVPGNYTLVSLISAGYAAGIPHPEKKPVDQVTFKNTYK